MRVPGPGVDFVPPAQADEASPGDVFEIVEIGGEEEHGEDEDEDAEGVGGLVRGWVGGREIVGGGKEGGRTSCWRRRGCRGRRGR